MDKTYCIYKHTLFDGRCYIGQTSMKPPSKRWGRGSNYKESPKFYNAIQKYGWDAFTHEILEDNLTLEEANKKEREYIHQFDSMNNGFNINYGGDCHIQTQETREKISKALKGRKFSQAHIEKLKLAQKGEKNHNFGKPRSEETKRKIGEANRKAQLGKKHSEETKQKMSLSHRKCDKYILCVETNKVYKCLREIELDINKRASHISEVCKGKRKTAYNMHWRYLTPEEKERYIKNGKLL